jgi:hypothetical protein
MKNNPMKIGFKTNIITINIIERNITRIIIKKIMSNKIISKIKIMKFKIIKITKIKIINLNLIIIKDINKNIMNIIFNVNKKIKSKKFKKLMSRLNI